jgi:Uma2 family endonuclease
MLDGLSTFARWLTGRDCAKSPPSHFLSSMPLQKFVATSFAEPGYNQFVLRCRFKANCQTMSTALNLTSDEFDQMVSRGAFDHLNRKIELIRGELREMNPAGPLHDDLIMYLNNWSFEAVAGEPIMVTSQTGLDLRSLQSRPEPDLLWVRAGRYLKRHPSASDVKLAIEVSSSSLQADLVEKAELYAEAGIVEYWIVDIGAKCVHVFRHPQGKEYTDRSASNLGERLSPLAAESASLEISGLFGESD